MCCRTLISSPRQSTRGLDSMADSLVLSVLCDVCGVGAPACERGGVVPALPQREEPGGAQGTAGGCVGHGNGRKRPPDRAVIVVHGPNGHADSTVLPRTPL